jgi:hypothetical protein
MKATGIGGPQTGPLSILIVGMHRSGTSALSGVLSILGVRVPGEHIAPGDDNPKGFFENKQIAAFHDRLLQRLDSNWYDVLPLSETWDRSPIGGALADELADLIAHELASEPMFLVKDPRICQFVPLWADALARLNRRFVCILPHRHPLEVANSLHRRNGFSRSHSLMLWLNHVLAAEHSTRELQRSVVLFGDLLADWRPVVRKITADLDFEWPRDLMRVQDEIDAFLEPEMRHHRQGAGPLDQYDQLHEYAAEVWAAVQQLTTNAMDADAMAKLDQVRSGLRQATSLFGPLIVNSQRSLQQARLDLESRSGAAAAEIARRDQAVSQADARLRDLEESQLRDRAALAADLHASSEAVREAQNRIVERDQILLETEVRIRDLETRLEERAMMVSDLTSALEAAADAAIGRLQFELETERMRVQVLAEQLEATRRLAHNRDNQIAEIYNSRSWMLLRPIRAPLRILRGEISHQEATRLFARAIFRSLPISPTLRNRWRESGLRYFRPSPAQQAIGKAGELDDVGSALPESSGDLALLPELSATPPQAIDVSVSVIIPTFNAGAEFFWLIKKLQAQKGLSAVEIVVIDSGSTDGTVELAKSAGCVLVQIDNSEFSHSYSRNLGADKATGDLLLFTVQDAFPIGDHWLQALAISLLYPDSEEKRVSALSCAEFPRTDTELLYNSLISTHYNFLGCHSSDRIGRLSGSDNISLRSQGQLSDIACIINRSLFLQYRYHGRYAEDLILGIRLIREGHSLGMISSVRVIHSHNRPESYYVRRVFVDIIFLTDVFSDFDTPHANSVIGTMACAYALSRRVRDWRPLEMASTAEVFASLRIELRDFRLPSVVPELTGDGFGFGPLAAWVQRYGEALAREGEPMNGSDIADAAQLRTMFVDRVANIAEFAEATYSIVDSTSAAQIRNGVQKTLSMAVGAQLAFIFLNHLKTSVSDTDVILELKSMLLEGI